MGGVFRMHNQYALVGFFMTNARRLGKCTPDRWKCSWSHKHHELFLQKERVSVPVLKTCSSSGFSRQRPLHRPVLLAPVTGLRPV